MKKIIVSVVVTVFVLMITAIYTQANTWASLSGDYFIKVSHVWNEKKDLMWKAYLEEKQLSFIEGQEEINGFYKNTSAKTRDEIQAYQQDYLSRIAETKNILGERNLKDYEWKKSQELQDEIGQDVKEYLEVLLDE